MLNYQLEIVGEELVTSIGDSDEFYVNLLFDRSIYRPMCTHMGNHISPVGEPMRSVFGILINTDSFDVILWTFYMCVGADLEKSIQLLLKNFSIYI